MGSRPLMVSTWRQVSIIGRPVELSSRNRRPPAAATALLLLALAALGCSTSPDDGSSPAIEEPSPTAEAALPTTTTQPDPPPTTTQPKPPPTTTTADEPEPPPTTTQPEQTEPSPTTSDDTSTEPEAATDLEPSTPADKDDETTADAGEPVTRISGGWLLPWGEGFLEVGYPIVDEDQEDRARLFTRVSADGLNWSPPARLSVPLPDTQIHDARRWGELDWAYTVTFGTGPDTQINDVHRWSQLRFVLGAGSDGKRLILAMQQGADVFAAITSDLTRWEVHKIPPPYRDGLPDGVEATTRGAPGLAVGPEGWLIYREIALEVDPWVIAPADIRESAQEIFLGNPDYVGGERVHGEPQGIEVEWRTEEHDPDDPFFSRFVTWEELGIDEDSYRDYGIAHFARKPGTPSWLASGEVWVAKWGNNPVRAALPTVGGFWGRVVGTDTGYFASAWEGEVGYPQVLGSHHFSADGSTWVGRSTPVDGGMPLSVGRSIVTDGIVLDGRLSYPFSDTERESQLWLGDATGTDWRPVELPEPSEDSWFELRSSHGGAVVVGGPSEDDSSVEWMMASRDGVNWLVVEDPTVADLRSFAINGDVMVGVDGQGNSRRFVIPTTEENDEATTLEGPYETIGHYPDLFHQDLLSWGEGFLHIGFRTTDEESCDVITGRSRFSTDGLVWTGFSDLEIPSVHAMPLRLTHEGYVPMDCGDFSYSFPLHISSNGKHFAIASQRPLAVDAWGGTSARSAALLDRILQEQTTIYLSITEDLSRWDTIEIPIDQPEDLHKSLHAAPNLVGLSLYDDGWVMELETMIYMNVFSIMPADIRESATSVNPKFDGPWHDENTGENGMTVEWWTDETPYDNPHIRFVSWEELGTTDLLYQEYGSDWYPYPLPELFEGSIFVSSWGEDPTRFDLPDFHICCEVVVTDAGYLAISDPEVPGYHPDWFGSGTMLFSTDARDWETISPLAGQEIVVHGFSRVNGGVLAFGSPLPHSAAFYEDDDDWERHVWLGSPDGSIWQRLDVPEDANLIEWLMAHDMAPIGWRGVAVQGNIVLQFIHDGGTQSYGDAWWYIPRLQRYVASD